MDFEALLREIEREVAAAAREALGSHARAAVRDSREFLLRIRADLERWTRMVADGRMSEQDFRSLVEGSKGVAEMHVLKRRGAAQAAIGKFQDRVIAIIIGRVLALIP
ncbi:MAG: hypothetical protein MUF78_11765 [Candidatus Edwardsbacteria bacterium]|jgi:hypothetical protein|nr:hypothetical protein [Candidatus Edwardsbacteria bacterium]